MKKAISMTAILIYIITAIVLFALIWSYLATVNVTIRVKGKVAPASGIQVVEHLHGGILSQIKVDEGEHVKRGQVVAILNRKGFAIEHQKAVSEKAALQAEVARLKAEAYGLEHIPFPEGFEKEYPKITEQTRALYQSNQQALQTELQSLRKIEEINQQEIKTIKPLVDRGVLSNMELLRLRRELLKVQGKIRSRIHEFRADAQRELTQSLAELKKAEHTHELAESKKEQLLLKSPVDGVVHKVKMKTPGSVVQAGETVMEIVPTDTQYIIEAQVKTQDLGYIEEGLSARITFSAQSMTQYGTIPAKLIHISPDATRDKVGNLYYDIKLKPSKTKFRSKAGKVIPMKPGMTVTVAIKVGERSVLGSILTPLFETLEPALKETSS